jgi:hypothetical protein
MDAKGGGFLVAFDFMDDDRPLIVEDDGRVCYAHVWGPTGNVVCHAWLYNRLPAPDDTHLSGLVWHAAPLNPHTHAHASTHGPLPASAADFRASLFAATNTPTTFYVFIRDELVATLDAAGRGRSRLAKRNGPLAQRLPMPGEMWWQVVAPYWRQVDIYRDGDVFLRTFGMVPQPAGLLLAAKWCESEVCNGGFHQFFGNSTGVLAPEAAMGFRAIGMPALADLVEQALALFGKPFPREQAQRRRFLDGFQGERRERWDPFFALDALFYAAMIDDALSDAADAYAARTMPGEAKLSLTREPQVEGRVCYSRHWRTE